MKFISTRENSKKFDAPECLLQGLASDGGLFVPENFPVVNLSDYKSTMSMSEFGQKVLAPFFAETSLASKLEKICDQAFNFQVPLEKIAKSKGLSVLELFHGPTAAFKDVGARFLANALIELGTKATVIVATSGDTGGAVASAFANQPGFDVIILYPRGKISQRQEKQLTSWGPSVRAFSVNGTFDDCQRIVKAALADSKLSNDHSFISANSISIGRLLPQMVYHARASLQYKSSTEKNATLIVPTGNLGDAVAALWAKRSGFPIDKVILATNSNRTLIDFFETGMYETRPTIATLANAMDVSAPSNFERLVHLYPDFEALKKDVQAFSISDSEISKAIAHGLEDYGQIWCPHTATAVVAREKSQIENAILVATAHPAKFETIVEPLIQKSVPVPTKLAETLRGSSVSFDLESDFDSFKRAIA
ncbi:threonine synthase [soil metagenome]